MPQTAEAQAFISRVSHLPSGVTVFDALSNALQPSLDDEAELRKLFATDKTNPRLKDIHVGLVDIFDAPQDIRTTRARVPKDEDDLIAKHIMPLSKERRRKDGVPAIVETLDEFKQNWAIFSEGSLSQLLDWNNVVAAGGSVQACLNPVPESAKVSKRALRKHFHTNAYPTSDVDLFLYGLTPAEAEAKIISIYEAVRDSVPWDVTCVRTKHTVSIHSQYPYRAVQIVLRLYTSPAEILAGFDVDAPCCAYDGQRVWANPRSIVAMMRQCNTVDMSHRSTSYEVRLAKYSLRGFEVHVPLLKREDIDPTIFERAINRIEGLARLLVLEKLIDTDTRQRYLTDRRDLRGRPYQTFVRSRKNNKVYKGDLKHTMDIGGLEMNDYDVVSLHIPYGPGWDARRIEKLIYQTDLGMNSPFNPKNKDRRLHRHPTYFGTMEECLEDCCEFCPEPRDDEEKALQEEEDKSYIRGRIEFIVEDPGRQSISGSFHPIDVGEWAEQAYMGPTEKLFFAIVTNDRMAVSSIISQEGFDLERRDHVGRTPLQIAIMSKAVDIACDLIDAGARMTSRIVDGRTTLHLAAQLDLPTIARKLLERSTVNSEKAKEEAKEAERAKQAEKEAKEAKMDVDSQDIEDKDDEDEEHNSSEDDWQSDGDEKSKQVEAKQDDGQIPEDEKDEPDVFDVNAPDWDATLTPLQYAVIYGSVGVVDELIAGGADVKLVTHRTQGYNNPYLHQLTVTILTEKDDAAGQIVQKLMAAGAVSSEADEDLFTIFHKFVCSRRPELVAALLRSDTNAKVVINAPYVPYWGHTTFPVVSAIATRDYATLAILLAYDAKLVFTEADFSRASDQRFSGRPNMNRYDIAYWRRALPMPIEAAITNYDDVVHLLIAAGAEVNFPTLQSCSEQEEFSVLDWVRCALGTATAYLERSGPDDPKWRAYVEGLKAGKGMFRQLLGGPPTSTPQSGTTLLRNPPTVNQSSEPSTTEEIAQAWMPEIKEYLEATDKSLVAHGATLRGTPADVSRERSGPVTPQPAVAEEIPGSPSIKGLNLCYNRDRNSWSSSPAPSFLTALYDELFEACLLGDNAKIQRLCLPKEGAQPTDNILQIAVTFGEHISPLSLALQGRHWDTARLHGQNSLFMVPQSFGRVVLAVATAQHRPEKSSGAVFQTRNITLDPDDDGDDDDVDETMEPEVMDFVDIAKRPSTVHISAAPVELLKQEAIWLNENETEAYQGVLLFKAIADNDFEAFVQIAELYKSLPKAQPLPDITLTWILQHDRPNMLDELIRWTGVGFNVEAQSESEHSQTETAHPKKSKTYLGLNVHGKKRKDLALKNDPDARPSARGFSLPLLWDAAQEGALNVIKYLSGIQALAAFQYYASTHNDQHARHIRRVPDLAAVLPESLGWTTNPLKESPYTAAVAANKLETLKALLAFQRPELQNALSARLNYVAFNHIHLLVSSRTCSVEMFEFLRAEGISATETDHRGWNIIHWLCLRASDKHVELLEHVLRILPEDDIRTMLTQQSRDAYNTPLHIAVKCKQVGIVRILLSTKASPFLLRDVKGSTVLHIAVKSYLAEITELLVNACPSEALYMEDGVGNTPLELVIQGSLLEKTGRGFPANMPDVPTLSSSWSLDDVATKKPFVIAKQKDELPRLRTTIQGLLKEGRLRSGTKLTTELLAFADKMEAKLVAEEAKAAGKEVKVEATGHATTEDSENISKTCEVLQAAIAQHPATQARYLVHLIDVHRSVRSSLDKSKTVIEQARNTHDEELAAEEKVDKEEDVKLKTFLTSWSSDCFDKDTM
ncbi:ankyrin [Amylocystis lapponica]|nr:ankyrin [Amylocystis lapponica]